MYGLVVRDLQQKLTRLKPQKFRKREKKLQTQQEQHKQKTKTKKTKQHKTFLVHVSHTCTTLHAQKHTRHTPSETLLKKVGERGSAGKTTTNSLVGTWGPYDQPGGS
eukprot:m.96924 g.96924  ORF g.96924 m.96924 type:complete len:107 (+) comp26940_c0_seq1:144-464(+)